MFTLIMALILFYSKYSRECNNLISKIRNIDIQIQYVCVDNKNIRNKCRNGKFFKLNGVPTIVIDNNGELEIYEGYKAFELIETFVQQPESGSKTAPELPQILQPPTEEGSEIINYTKDDDIGDGTILSNNDSKANVKDLAAKMEQERKNM